MWDPPDLRIPHNCQGRTPLKPHLFLPITSLATSLEGPVADLASSVTVPSRIMGWLLKAAGRPVPCILRANEETPKPEAGGEELGSTFAHCPSQNDLTLPQSPTCPGICHWALTPSARSCPFLGLLPGPTGANQGNRVCCWVPWQVQPLTAISQSEEIKRRWALFLASPWDGKFPLWAVADMSPQFLEMELPAAVRITYVALCGGQSTHRAGTLSAVFRDLPSCLCPNLGTSDRAMPWTGCLLLLTLFVSVWLASHLEAGAS